MFCSWSCCSHPPLPLSPPPVFCFLPPHSGVPALRPMSSSRGTDISPPDNSPPDNYPPDNNNPGQQPPRTRTIPPPYIYTYTNVNSVSGIELNNYCTISVD